MRQYAPKYPLKWRAQTAESAGTTRGIQVKIAIDSVQPVRHAGATSADWFPRASLNGWKWSVIFAKVIRISVEPAGGRYDNPDAADASARRVYGNRRHVAVRHSARAAWSSRWINGEELHTRITEKRE